MRRFAEEVGAYPWEWTSADLDRFMAQLRAERDLARSTVRSCGPYRRMVLQLCVRPGLCVSDSSASRPSAPWPCRSAQPRTSPGTAYAARRGPPGDRSPSRSASGSSAAADERAVAVRHRGAKGSVPASGTPAS